MDAPVMLNKILTAGKPEDIFSIRNFKKEYADLVKLLHPDVCHLPRAGDAVAKLNNYREQMGKYSNGEDDAGSFALTADNEVAFTGDAALLMRSYENYRMLMSFGDTAATNFKRYLPQSMHFSGDELIVKSAHRMLPLTHLVLLPEHTNWVLSRIYELIGWFHQTGYCHLGINPESVFIVPGTHGIVCVSFYHFTKTDSKPGTLSGRYLNWYPAVVFKQKKAIPYLDISLAQRTALYALGDRSGNGISLKKTVNEHLIDFLITPHYNTYQTYTAYRTLLQQQFGKPTFHPLNI